MRKWNVTNYEGFAEFILIDLDDDSIIAYV